jgi:predicted nucleic acid-binding protein
VNVLVDSDILIEVLRGRDLEIIERWLELADSDDLVLCSAVSIAELWAGARTSEYRALVNLFKTLTIVPAGEPAGRQAGEYLRAYQKSHGVELGDALIAASAVLSGALLWTRNRKHYPMKGLKFF